MQRRYKETASDKKRNDRFERILYAIARENMSCVQISKMTKISIRTTHADMHLLVGLGYAEPEFDGNHKRYSAATTAQQEMADNRAMGKIMYVHEYSTPKARDKYSEKNRETLSLLAGAKDHGARWAIILEAR